MSEHDVSAYWLYTGDVAFSFDPHASYPLRIHSADEKPIADLSTDQAKKLLTFLRDYFEEKGGEQ